MDSGLGTRKGSKKNSDALDDILGDLLSDDSPVRRKPASSAPTRQRAGSGKGPKAGGKDDTFYSSLAAMADSDGGSDISEADVNKVAHSLGGLDDMDADLFGDALSKKSSTGRSSGKPTTPRRTTPRSKGTKSPTRVQSPTRSETPTSPPGSARGSLKRKPQKPPSPSTVPANPLSSPPQAQPDQKPGTAPGKMTDLSSASESLIPGQKATQRPDTAPKVKKKYEFGDFDPDDPLAGMFSDDDVDDLSESDRPKSATRKPAAAVPPQAADIVAEAGQRASPRDSPRRQALMERPPTRSGSNAGDIGAGGDTKTGAGAENGGARPAPKPQGGGGIFSDSDGDMLDGLGLEETAATPAKRGNNVGVKSKTGDTEEQRPARSVLDSLLGKGTNTAAQLLEPKEKKQFVLDSKYSSSQAGSLDGRDEEDFNFGSYQPSAVSGGSRPNSRRSVRFQDDDDIFGLESRPSPRSKSPGLKKAPPDMEWLELAAKPTPSEAPATTALAPTAQTTNTPTTTPAASSNTVVSAAKPPALPTSQRPPESPRKSTPSGQTPSAVANTAPSPRAWLGLEDSESDDELFKPKISSARSSTLPQSPALSTSASPRVFPKKPTKKDRSSPKVSPAVSVVKDDDEDDDWLARARSRRQQMLSKDEGKGAGSARSVQSGDQGENKPVPNGEELDGQSMKVDLSSLIVDSPKFGESARTEMSNDIFSAPQGRPFGGPSWESQKTAPSMAARGGQLQDVQSPVTPQMPTQDMSSDPRLKFSAASFTRDQTFSDSALSTQGLLPTNQQQTLLQLQHQQQQQQQYQQIRDQLLQQQQLQGSQPLSVPFQLPPSSQVMPPYSQISSTVELPDNLPEAHAKIRRLALEKGYSDSLVESTKRRFEEEMFAVETSYKNRLQILEDSNRKREARLREENEELMQQHLAKVRQLEQEKSDVSTSHYRKLEDLERDKAQEMEKLKEQHRLSLASLKREHEEALERLANAKNQEINMVASANDTSKSLTAVVEQIRNNARDLGELQLKLDTWSRQGLDEREISLRSKDEQLRILQERLNRQEEDNDRERKRLEELIARMETQLRDQTRLMEEERWKLKQDQSRVEAQQRALEEERRMWLEQQARERITMERARENYLEEQRNAMAQISEERRMLTEERTKFQVEQKTFREKMQQDSIKRGQAEADYEVLMRTIGEEKLHHSTRIKELQREEERIATERNKLERELTKLEQDREKLAKQARQIQEQSEQIDHVTEAARRTHQEGEQAMEEAVQYGAEIERREAETQKQHNSLKLMEEHISQEKLRLAKEKKEVENLKNASLCTNCRSPLHGGPTGNLPIQNGYYTPQQMSLRDQPSVHMVSLSASAHQMGANPLDNIAASIASDRAVRMLKIQAIKDKAYLQEESIYLESLRHTPYHSTASKT